MTVEAPQIENTEAAEALIVEPVEVNDDQAMNDAYDAIEAAEAPRERDEQGKFKSTAKPEATEAADDKTSLEGEEGAAAKVEGSTAETDVAAPAHLPQAIKSDWEKLSPEARSAMVEQQTASDRKFSELGRQIEQSRPIVERLTQATQEIPQFAGMQPEQLAQGAMELAAIQVQLEQGSPEQKSQTVLQIAQQYGVLPQLAAQLSGQGVDQNVLSLQNEIATLKQQIAQGNQTQFSPEMIDAKVSEALSQRDIQSAVDSFAQSKPFFAEVESILPQFVHLVKEQQPGASDAEVLEAAYDMAINANPTTRQKVRELEAQDATTIDLDTKRAEQAKKAASINVKPTVGGKQRVMSEDEALSNAYDRAAAN